MATTPHHQLVRFFSIFEPSTYAIFLAIIFIPMIVFLIMSGMSFLKSISTAAAFVITAAAGYACLAFLP